MGLDDLRVGLAKHEGLVAGLMITYPSTHGVYEPTVREVCGLVHEAGAKIDEVVSGVGSVAQLVDEISRTTVEQSAGIATVSQTVTEIDKMTRQNTALVHQSAEAAESLRVQAAQLLGVAG